MVDLEQREEKTYVMENEFSKQRRTGPEIELGEFISKVIDFNVCHNDE